MDNSKRKRFLIKSRPDLDRWDLFWVGVDGIPEPRLVASVYDIETLDLFTQAPALRQMADVNKRLADNPAMHLRKRQYNTSVFGRFQELYARWIKS